MELPGAAARPIAGLDTVRRRILAIAGPRAPSLLRDREVRVFALGLSAIVVALGATFAAPMLLLAVGPIVLGVPHLVADVRYLVARPGLHRRPDFWLFVVSPAIASWLLPHAWLSMLGLVGAAAIARAPVRRRAVGAVLAVGLVALGIRFGRSADLAFAHAHNLVAVALFALWSPRSRRLHWLVVLAFVAASVVVAAGAFDGAALARLRASRLLDAEDVVRGLATPLVTDPVLAGRAVLLFAFAQSVHYAVWVRLIPEDDRPRAGLRSFASSVRAASDDLGVPALATAGVLALLIAGTACVSLGAARDGYLRLAMFHGPLELGAAVVLLLERGRLRSFGSFATRASPT